MALDLGTILAAVELVERALAIYNRIESLPEQMKQLGRRMERLNIFLVRLEAFVKQRSTTASATLYAGQLKDLGMLLEGIKCKAEKVYDLFDRYEKGILSRSMQLEFRAKWVSHLWFSLVDNSPDKVQAIMEDIDFDRGVLSDYLGLMAIDRPNRRLEAIAPSRRASPSPSPIPPRRDYRLLFVDPYNEGRSVVAEALVKLLGQSTLQSHGDWRIEETCSAGFFVKAESDCVGVIDGLQYSFKSFKKPWRAGGQNAESTAIAAVFDNKWCDYPFKKDIHTDVAARKSSGMRKDMFTRFDFIVVFTRREHDNVIKLKEALHKEAGVNGKDFRAKGRVLQLGTYLSQKGGVMREILWPQNTRDGSPSRECWNRKVSEIKTALKVFLRQEMDWKQLDHKPTTTSGQTAS